MDRESFERLCRCWTELLPSNPGRQTALFRLVNAYQSPGRHYHTLDHVADVLERIDELSPHAADLAAVRLAAWYHEEVYDPRAGDNEERSAELAAAELPTLGVSPTRVERVVELILGTKTHEATTADAAVLLDADLAILGADEPDYDRFAAAVHREYAWVDGTAYRSGRAAVLRRFLARPHIFHTPPMRASREPPARTNLAREIARLEVGCPD